MIDLSDENYLTAYDTLCKELSSFSDELVKKEHIIIATKLDLAGTEERLIEMKKALEKRCKVVGISVFNDWGMEEVKKELVNLFNKSKKIEVEDSSHFMMQELEEPSYEVRDDFGATISLSRKRRAKR